jgi:hypothetical protein
LPTIYEDTPHDFAVKDFPQGLERLKVAKNKKIKNNDKETMKKHPIFLSMVKANDTQPSTLNPVRNLRKKRSSLFTTYHQLNDNIIHKIQQKSTEILSYHFESEANLSTGQELFELSTITEKLAQALQAFKTRAIARNRPNLSLKHSTSRVIPELSSNPAQGIALEGTTAATNVSQQAMQPPSQYSQENRRPKKCSTQQYDVLQAQPDPALSQIDDAHILKHDQVQQIDFSPESPSALKIEPPIRKDDRKFAISISAPFPFMAPTTKPPSKPSRLSTRQPFALIIPPSMIHYSQNFRFLTVSTAPHGVTPSVPFSFPSIKHPSLSEYAASPNYQDDISERSRNFNDSFSERLEKVTTQQQFRLPQNANNFLVGSSRTLWKIPRLHLSTAVLKNVFNTDVPLPVPYAAPLLPPPPKPGGAHQVTTEYPISSTGIPVHLRPLLQIMLPPSPTPLASSCTMPYSW